MPSADRFRCTLAAAALDAIAGACVGWPDSRGLNAYEQKALELSGESVARRAARAEPEAEP